MALAELGRCHSFPRCPATDQLGQYLGEWKSLRTKHEAKITDTRVWAMLHNMLPEDAQRDVRTRREELSTTQSVNNYVDGELARYQNSYPAKIKDRSVTNTFNTGPRNPVNHVQETQSVSDQIGKLRQPVEAIAQMMLRHVP